MVPDLLIPYVYSVINFVAQMLRLVFLQDYNVTSTHGLLDNTSNTSVRWCCIRTLNFGNWARNLGF